MPTWAMMRSPMSPSPRQSLGSPSVRPVASSRRPKSAPAARPASGRVENMSTSPTKKTFSRRGGSKPMHQPQPWAPSCSLEAAEKRPWMMSRAANPARKSVREELSRDARCNAESRYRRGYGQLRSSLSLTPPSRKPSQQLQSSKKHPCDAVRRRENPSLALKDRRSNGPPGEKQSSSKMPADFEGRESHTDRDGQAERHLTCTLEKENIELRALAARLSAELAAAEHRGALYQNAAEELTREGMESWDFEDSEFDVESQCAQVRCADSAEQSSELVVEPSDYTSACLLDSGSSNDRTHWALVPRTLW
jgi:hypothetical protein